MSASKRHTVGNLLFWFQIVCALIFCISQALRMLKSTEGVSFSLFVCHSVFTLLNLSLSVAALKNAVYGERIIKRQAVYMYAMWTLILALHTGIAFWKMEHLWKQIDTLTALIVVIGIILVLAIAKVKKLSLLDPYVKAGLAISFKAVPQFTLALVIYYSGKGGLSGIWILFGHVTILTRLVHLWISNHEKWDRNTKGSFVSEVWNELSWLVATAAWLLC